MSAARHSLQPGDVIRIRGERWLVARLALLGQVPVVDVSGAEPSNAGIRTAFLVPAERIEPIPHDRRPRLVRPAVWRRRALGVLARALPDASSLRSPVTADIDVLPYQLEPALAVTNGLGSRLLIADDVGLGKTIQAGLIAAEVLARRPDGRVLVITPASLRQQWQAELRARLGLSASILDRPALAGQHGAAGMNPWAAAPLAITSIDLVKRVEVMRALEGLVWDLVIFDEAHALAGRSDRAAAAQAIGERARTVVLLSATPHPGDDRAFARLCAIGDIGRAFPLLFFRRTRTDAGLASRRRMRWLPVRPTAEESQLHAALSRYARRIWHESDASGRGARLAAAVLMRRAFSSAASLARSLSRRKALLSSGHPGWSTQMNLPFGETPEDDEPDLLLASAGFHDAAAEHVAIEALIVLAERAAKRESKPAAVRRLLRRTREPVIVFTEYRDTLLRLASALDGVPTVLVHGGLTAGERADALRAFIGGTERVLLATDAAAEGLNLQARCRLVVNLELPWTPVRLEQRIGRVDRIGQRRTVHAVQLVASGTGEERTLERLHRRLDGIRARLGSFRTPALSDEDVARWVAGNGTVPDPLPMADSLPSALTEPDLRGRAEIEAGRIRLCRRLQPRPGGSELSRPRPVLTRFRRGQRGRYWVYELPFSTCDGEPVWTLTLALCAQAPPAGSSRGAIAGLLGSMDPEIAARLDLERDRALDGLRALLRDALDLASRREHAIARVLARRHGQLAAGLLQRGLFDRRSERLAAAQAELAASAAARCTARLERIGCWQRLESAGRGLVCAVLVG